MVKLSHSCRPADLPVGKPTRFQPVVNLNIADSLGVTIPLSVIGRADHVIQ